VLGALAPAAASADIGSLRWAPPTLVNPTTIQLGQGVTNTVLDPAKDYIVKLPPYQKLGGTEIEGGHNVVIQGGSIAIPPGLSSDAERRGIYIKNNEGTVHIEGVLIQGLPGSIGDGIDISAPDSTVQIENDRIVNMSGGLSTFHADVIQPWGGVRDLRVDGLTGSSNYQGLFLAQDLGPIGRVELQHVNLSQTPGPYDGGGHMLWITSGASTCTSYPLSLSNVYIAPRAGRSLGTSVWPQIGSSLACPGVGSLDGSVSWPALSVSGGVNVGAPAGGDYVPDGLAGLAYSTPGYSDGAAPPESPAPTAPSGGTQSPSPQPPPDASAPAQPPAALGPAAPTAPAERKVVHSHPVVHKKHQAKPKRKKKRHHHKRKSHKHR
jgi:hypothetical protein